VDVGIAEPGAIPDPVPSFSHSRVRGLANLAYVSLGFLHLFTIMLAAAFLPRPFAALGACAALNEIFSSLDLLPRAGRF